MHWKQFKFVLQKSAEAYPAKTYKHISSGEILFFRIKNGDLNLNITILFALKVCPIIGLIFYKSVRI